MEARFSWRIIENVPRKTIECAKDKYEVHVSATQHGIG